MRIRIYRAFASNNSGSYTLLGSFSTPAAAEHVAAELQALCDAHDDWIEATPYPYEGQAPLDTFVQANGLSAAEPPGRSDEWPEHGPKPAVVAAGHQVLFHVPYTVTMPPLFGEVLYKRGGRVELELNHAHHDLAVDLGYYPSDTELPAPAKAAALDAFETLLRAELPALSARPENDSRPAIAPVFHRGTWGLRQLSLVLPDLVAGVRHVRALADAAAMNLHVRVWECPGDSEDPFAALRAQPRPWGRFRVILWQVGSDRIAAMKAVRDALACGLSEAKEALAELPREVLVDVSEQVARDAALRLTEAGCDAEVVAPAPPR